jgi:GNAT superfamily N-acetyltransferase
MRWEKGVYSVDTNPDLLSLDVIHGYLSRSYWAEGRPRETVAGSLQHSVNFGVYFLDQQVGFARAVTDFTTFYWLCDVFILEEYRGRDLGKWLIECVTNHPDLQGLLGVLATRDAQGLYEKYGFSVASDPRKFMWTRKPA